MEHEKSILRSIKLSTHTGAGFVFTNNIARHNAYGVFGDSTSPGFGALNTYFPGYVFRRNVAAASGYVINHNTYYLPDNFYPLSFDSVAFVDRAGGNYHLSSTGPYLKAATDGKDIGCDFNVLTAATAGTSLSTTSTPTPTPTPTPVTPPTVSITLPTNDVTVNAGVNVNVSATATSGDSTISRVDFYDDTQLIGAITAAPYSVLWGSVPAGKHTLTAKAIYSRGLSTMSSP